MKHIFFWIFCVFGTAAHAERYTIEEIQFTSRDTGLSGSLIYPKDHDIHSAIVFVHGSGPQTRGIYWAERFASEGIAAFVYDKRGVGRSGGKYEAKQSVSEKNLNLLADDAIAALSVLSNHKKTKGLPIGVAGISQAGWIVPLAVQRSDIPKFMVLWSGPVCKVSEEDIFSKYTADIDGEKIPSFAEALRARKTPYIWPDFLGKDTDSSEALSTIKIPGLWMFGAKDGSVPVDLSVQRLEKHVDLGRDYEYVLFSSLGHNNMDETFSTATAWIKRLSR